MSGNTDPLPLGVRAVEKLKYIEVADRRLLIVIVDTTVTKEAFQLFGGTVRVEEAEQMYAIFGDGLETRKDNETGLLSCKAEAFRCSGRDNGL